MRLIRFLALMVSLLAHSSGVCAGYYSESDDTLNGKHITYFESGAIRSEGAYINGKRHGEFFHYFENGKLEYRVFHLNDVKIAWINYNDSGKVLRCSHDLSFYPDSSVESLGGKETNVYIKFYQNGQLMVWMNFENGFAQGESVSYYENGQLWAVGSYKDDKETGLWVEYWSNGNLYKKGRYVDGKPDGEWIIGSKDGLTVETRNY